MITHESVLAEIGRLLDGPTLPRPPEMLPAEGFIQSRKLGHSVADRIRGYYPSGIEEGSLVKGYFTKPLSWRRAKRAMGRGKTVYLFRERGGKQIYNAAMRGPHPMSDEWRRYL